MESLEPDEPDLIHPHPLIWLEFRLLNSPSPERPRSPFSPTTFPLFSSLPPELRLKIYGESLVPRTILLTCKTSDPPSSVPRPSITSTLSRPTDSLPPPYNTSGPTEPEPARPRFTCSPPPALLHVSREARTFAQRHYVPSFGYSISPLHTCTPLRLAPRVFFDFARDSLLLAGELEPRDVHGFYGPMVYFLDKGECARVRRVACHVDALLPSVPRLPATDADGITRAIPARQEVDPEVVFVMLSHVLDRFSGVDMLPVLFDGRKCAEPGAGPLSLEEGGRDAIQKIWDGWVLGVTATDSPLRGKRIPLVSEDELGEAWDSDY